MSALDLLKFVDDEQRFREEISKYKVVVPGSLAELAFELRDKVLPLRREYDNLNCLWSGWETVFRKCNPRLLVNCTEVSFWFKEDKK